MLLANPVAAQDVAEDYREVYTQTYGTGLPDRAATAAVGLGVLPLLIGSWAQADAFAENADLDHDAVSSACLFTPIFITADGAFGFQLEHTRRDGPRGNSRRFSHVSGRYFQFVTDLDGLLNILTGGRPLEEFPPRQVVDWLSNTSGMARIEMVSPDVVLIDSPDVPPMILVRCP